MRRAAAPALSGLGIRARLTVLYGGMFLLAGTALIVILYLLFKNSYPGGKAVANILSGSENPGPHTVIQLRSGARLTLPDVTAIRQKFDHHRARALTTLVYRVPARAGRGGRGGRRLRMGHGRPGTQPGAPYHPDRPPGGRRQPARADRAGRAR